MRPSAARTVRTPASMEASSVTSICNGTTPDSLSGSMRSTRRAAAYTRCPCRASVAAASNPMPLLAPVIKMTFVISSEVEKSIS